jgi:uncharacterized membrane protein YhfC
MFHVKQFKNNKAIPKKKSKSRILYHAILLVIGIGLIFLLTTQKAAAPLLNALLMIAIPLALGIILVQHQRVEWRLFSLGCLSFLISQIGHIPFNQWGLNPIIQKLDWQMTPGSIQLLAIGLAYGASAGFFEETTRLLFYRLWGANDHKWSSGLMFGAGHGGLESMLFGVLSLFSFFQLLTLRSADLVVIGIENPAAVQATIQTFWSTPWHDHLLGAAERLSAICIHLSLSLLVLQVFIRRKIRWYLVAIAWHTLIDAIAVFGITTWGIYLTEAIILFTAILSLVLVFVLRPTRPDTTLQLETTPSALPTVPTQKSEIQDITLEQLEESKYD